MTPTGQALALQSLPGDVDVDYLPFDLGFAQSRFLRRQQPRSLVLVEGEMWPLLQRTLRRRKIPIVMINGRISDRSFNRLRRLQRLWPPLLRPILAPVKAFGVQTQADKQRLTLLGVDGGKVTVTGNLKFDTEAPPADPALERLILGVADGRKVLVAGSTMAGEDGQVLNALAQLHQQDPLLVLAPRHPERFGEVAGRAQRQGFTVLRRSEVQLLDPGEAVPSYGRPQVLLLDTLGELASVYRWADAAFVGGTLVPTGGHNPLEPARCDAPTCVGPSMENFREIAALFDQRDAWQRVADQVALAATWRRWLEDPREAEAVARRARQLVDQNRGAAQRSVDLVRRSLVGLQ